VALGLALLTSVGSSSAGAPRLAVIGFQEEGTPTRAIDRSAGSLAVVGVDGINLTGGGSAVAMPDAAALAELAGARRNHLPADLLVGNFSNQIGDFSEPLAHGLLSSPTAIAGVTQTLAGLVASQGWNGITLDLESLLPRDTAGLTAFVSALRTALPPGVSLGICIQNSTQAAGFTAAGYDLRALGASVDHLILMAYDDHGPWENQPGAVGPLGWQQAGLGVVLRSVPAAKVDLGVAGYGYAWRPHSNDMLSDAGARALVARTGARKHFDRGAGEWTSTLPDGSTLWWSDARSLALRVRIARRAHLDGLAIWSLGLSDPIRLPN
jgi:spore germination protein YaaH